MHHVDSIIYMSVCLFYPYLIILVLIIPINPSCVLGIFFKCDRFILPLNLESFAKFHKNIFQILIGITQNLSINLKIIWFSSQKNSLRNVLCLVFCIFHLHGSGNLPIYG